MRLDHDRKPIIQYVIPFLVVSFAVLIFGAGAGISEASDTSSSPSTTLEDLSGEYQLSRFTVKYNSGKTLKSEDVSFEGEMFIYESGYIIQDMTVSGKQVHIEGEIEILDESTLRMNSQDIIYKLGYDYDGNELVTYLKDVAAFPYDETDHWTKISDVPPER